MRVTQNNFYNSFIYDQQNFKTELNTVNRQISSGLKIKYGYEDTSVFADTLRLDYEEHSLNQVVNVATDAQNFANNTDSVMFQFTDALTRFKTLLVQAANGTNDDNNFYAISNELESLKDNMINLGNTSINGRYLFSGSATDVKPIDANGNYYGNDKTLKAVVGANVEVPYNIPGTELFFGEDNNYHRTVTTNVPLYKKIDYDKKELGLTDVRPDTPEYITTENTLEEMTGWEGDVSNDNKIYFYVTGKDSNGKSFKDIMEFDKDIKVDELLEKIGNIYGNTPTNKVVNVTLNNGRIEIQDKQSGSSMLDFSMVASDKKVTDIRETLQDPDAHVMFFNSGERAPDFALSTIASSRNTDVTNSFILNTLFLDKNSQKQADLNTKLKDIFPSDNDGSNNDDVKSISFSGKDVNGNNVNGFINIDDTATMQDLLNKLNTTFGVDAVLNEQGRIELVDSSGNNGDNFFIDSFSTMNDVNGGGSAIDGLRSEVTVESNDFTKSANMLLSSVSQIVKADNSYAVDSTKLVDVSAGSDIDNLSLDMDLTDKDGNNVAANIFRDSADGGKIKVRVDTDKDGTWDKTFTVKNADGTDTVEDSVNDIHQFTMKQLTDVVSVVMAGKYNDIDYTTTPPYTYTDAVDSARKSVDTRLDDKGRIVIEDKTKADTNMRISLFDSNSYDYTPDADGKYTSSLFTFQSNNSLTIDDPKHDFFASLDEAIEAVRLGRFRPDGTDIVSSRNIGIEGSLEKIDHVLNHFTKEHTKIGAMSNRLGYAVERNETLKINVQTLRSDILDTDIGEASMRLNQLTLNFQALYSTITKINSLSLVNYMK
ncbi:flagellin [Hydrogenimonas thermophila]|uniref:Flagellin n=1 Tax=Hydrogenimonas thermophila TaxID=223786 RepID=A0A1I5PXH6_9BACT|nr:flagellin [Hydrogenimonas thermophila]SFP38734.1 flagellar hook-associated protein 3 FlgL [Hydrogenimonas thermophila]